MGVESVWWIGRFACVLLLAASAVDLYNEALTRVGGHEVWARKQNPQQGKQDNNGPFPIN